MKNPFSLALGLTLLLALQAAQAVTLTWQPLGDPGVGGRVTGITVSPHDLQRIVAGGDILGLSLSTDGGATWEATYGLRGCQEMEGITFHPTDPNIVWAGSVGGPWKSADGGKSWTLKRSGFPGNVFGTFVAPVQKVIFDPDESQRLLAFTGVRRGSTGIYSNTFVGYVYVSINGGDNWTQLANIGSQVQHAAFLSGAGNGGTLFAATNAGLYRSTNDGANWTKITAGLPGGAINWVTTSVQNPNNVWVTHPDNGVYTDPSLG